MSYSVFLQTYLNYAFAICICPYLFSRSHDNKVEILQFKLQQGICILSAVLDLFGSISRIRIKLQTPLNNPVSYFGLSWSITAFIMHSMMYKALWTKQNFFRNAIDLCQEIWSTVHVTPKTLLVRLTAVILCTISLLLSFLPAIKGSGIRPESVPWSAESVLKSHVVLGKFTFFLSNDSVVNPTELEELEMTSTNILIGTAHILVFSLRYVGAYFIDLGLLFAVITLWRAVNAFHKEYVTQTSLFKDKQFVDVNAFKRLSTSASTNSPMSFDIDEIFIPGRYEERDKEECFRNIVTQYNNVKDLADNINASFGAVIFCYLIETTLYYATNLNTIFTSAAWHSKLTVAHFLIGCCGIFGLSADICRKMGDFKLWLCTEQRTKRAFPQDQLQILLQELDLHPIGISGMGVFTIDFSLIFVVLSTTVTYFLIVVG